MTKHEELNIYFYKKTIPDWGIGNIIDTSQALGVNKHLAFINFLSVATIDGLIDTITAIQSGGVYDQEFLDNDEYFYGSGISFGIPYFYAGVDQMIHMNDLKLLLQEWKDFINS